VVEASLKQSESRDHGEFARMIAERARRAHDLYLRARQRVVRLNADTFTVPSSASGRPYRVRYGGTVEACSCVDFEVHAGRVPCKHVQMLGIMFAVRRRPGVPEVAEIAVSKAGDPFAHAGTKREVEK
jgi:hypothetical protein